MKEQLTFKAMILNELDNGAKGLTADELAEISGAYSSGSNLRKVLRDEKKEFENFTGLVKMVNHIWGNDSIKMMAKYAEEINTNKNTARNLLEYFVSNAEYEAFNNLLDRMDQSTNNKSKEYAKIYRMQYRYRNAMTSDEFNELIQEITEIHVTLKELQVYKKMLISYCCFLNQDYNKLQFLLKQIDKDMDSVENEYIKEMYLVRVNEVKCYTYLKALNDPETAREYADWIINSNAEKGFKAYAYFLKAHSYMFTSYDAAMKYYELSLQNYEGRQRDIDEIKEEIEFVKIYWGKEVTHNYIKNELFFEIKKGNTVSLNEYNLKPEFKLYLEGFSTKNNNKLVMSMIKYIKNKDLFLANLAKIELIKNGYDNEIISEMISINVA